MALETLCTAFILTRSGMHCHDGSTPRLTKKIQNMRIFRRDCSTERKKYQLSKIKIAEWLNAQPYARRTAWRAVLGDNTDPDFVLPNTYTQ